MPNEKPLLCQKCAGSSCQPPTSGFVPTDIRQPFEKIKFAAMAEAPGEHEVWQGIPLCGATGQQLQIRIMNPLGIEREDVIFDNLIRCRPDKNNFPVGKLGQDMMQTCRMWDSIIDLYAPTVVILAFHPTFALIYTNQAYSTFNAFRKALLLNERGERPLIAMGQKFKDTLFPSLPGSITDWDGKHFFVDWKRNGAFVGVEAYKIAINQRSEKKVLTLKELLDNPMG